MNHYVCTAVRFDDRGHVAGTSVMRVNRDDRQFYQPELRLKREFGIGGPNECPCYVETWHRPAWWRRLLNRAGH